MNRKSIISTPNPSLRKKSQRIPHVDEKVLDTIKHMESATLDWEKHREHELGVALAAVQIDKLLNIVIVRHNTEDKNDIKFDVLINPQIIRKSKDITMDYEGCLSIPNIYGLVPRANSVKVKALDTQGHEIRITAEGFMARVLQHEIDHLHGVLFIDHIKDDSEAFFKLDKQGELQPLNYEKDIKHNSILW